MATINEQAVGEAPVTKKFYVFRKLVGWESVTVEATSKSVAIDIADELDAWEEYLVPEFDGEYTAEEQAVEDAWLAKISGADDKATEGTN